MKRRRKRKMMYFYDRYGYIVLSLPIIDDNHFWQDDWVVEDLNGKRRTAADILFHEINNLSRETRHPKDFAYGGFFPEDENYDVDAYNDRVAENYR